MKADLYPRPGVSIVHSAPYLESRIFSGDAQAKRLYKPSLYERFGGWLVGLAACPWGAHAGLGPGDYHYGAWTSGDPGIEISTQMSKVSRPQIYTLAQRARRDASPWTTVQAVLAPLQFVACALSLLLIVHYLSTGRDYALATGSILLKTALLYAIMITGSIWEKDVFGRWLFARAFFWEDMVSMIVLGLQTTYVVALLRGWGSPAEQMAIAIAAYAAYAVNASQFLIKLRAARLDAAPRRALAA